MTDEILPVPTVRELAAQGAELAVAIEWNKDKLPTKWRVTDAGHAEMGRIMRHNADVRRARGEGDWVQPLTRTDLGGITP